MKFINTAQLMNFVKISQDTKKLTSAVISNQELSIRSYSKRVSPLQNELLLKPKIYLDTINSHSCNQTHSFFNKRSRLCIITKSGANLYCLNMNLLESISPLDYWQIRCEQNVLEVLLISHKEKLAIDHEKKVQHNIQMTSWLRYYKYNILRNKNYYILNDGFDNQATDKSQCKHKIGIDGHLTLGRQTYKNTQGELIMIVDTKEVERATLGWTKYDDCALRYFVKVYQTTIVYKGKFYIRYTIHTPHLPREDSPHSMQMIGTHQIVQNYLQLTGSKTLAVRSFSKSGRTGTFIASAIIYMDAQKGFFYNKEENQDLVRNLCDLHYDIKTDQQFSAICNVAISLH